MGTFEVGDIVQLKSGGPKMTVTRIIRRKEGLFDEAMTKIKGLNVGDVVCTWFDGEAKQESGFAADALEKVEAGRR